MYQMPVPRGGRNIPWTTGVISNVRHGHTCYPSPMSRKDPEMFSHALSGFAAHHRSIKQVDGLSKDMERRRALRVELPFPVTVRGTDATGEHFTVDAVLDNLSACGLYFRLSRPVAPGAKLFVVVRLALGSEPEAAPGVAMRGVVVRAELLDDGRCGVAVSFDSHRFLYAS